MFSLQENEREGERKGRDPRDMRDDRDVCQKRARSASTDRQFKRQRPQPDGKRVISGTDDRTRRQGSQPEKKDWVYL